MQPLTTVHPKRTRAAGRTLARTAGALLLTCLLAVLAGAPAQAQQDGGPEYKLEDFKLGSYDFGNDFTLTNENGGTTSLSDFRGKAVLIFFGYTHCPDVCPVELSQFARVKRELTEAQREQMEGVFISVDPDRDTPERLRKYTANFDPAFHGLTASEEKLREIAPKWNVNWRKREAEGEDTYYVDHTAFTYLVDPQGRVRYVFPFGVDNRFKVQAVQAVLKGNA